MNLHAHACQQLRAGSLTNLKKNRILLTGSYKPWGSTKIKSRPLDLDVHDHIDN